jgi:DNA invertase Pin-like site-specific DNA recombinase
MSTFGYARVSTRDQNPALQLDALKAAGISDIHQETGSGAKARPILAALLATLQAGDVLAVWKLDRLGRSARDVILTVADLRERGIVIRSLTEGVDTGTPAGRAFIQIMAVLAELERETTLERIHAGIAISRAEGRHGRKPGYDIARIRHASDLIQGGASLRTAARQVGLARSTLADALHRMPTS